MSSQTFDDATPLEDIAQLVAYMAAGGKSRDRWVVGTEHEKLGWWPAKGTYPTWEGPQGIGVLLEAIAARGGWTVKREGPDIVALSRDRAGITLEPGGQLELSGAPLHTLAETEAELDAHFAEVRSISEGLGITWSGLGYGPTGEPQDVPRMPKARYGIMRRYLPTVGAYGPHMMHLTCTVQANYDFGDEVDAMRKLRVGMYLQPLIIGLFASSTVARGQVVPERSFRARIWEDVDNSRCVFDDAVLAPGAGFREYVEWALDIPMFFIYRDDRYIDCSGLRFRDFMRDGYQGERANVGDFGLHLSTLFPDVRLKQHLEVRGADMGDREHILALPAVHKGIFYDDAALAGCEALFAGVSWDDWRAARKAVAVEGLAARMGRRTLQAFAVEVLELSRAGLGRLEPDAVRMLDVLDADARAGTCPSDRIRESYRGDPAALIAAARIC